MNRFIMVMAAVVAMGCGGGGTLYQSCMAARDNKAHQSYSILRCHGTSHQGLRRVR